MYISAYKRRRHEQSDMRVDKDDTSLLAGAGMEGWRESRRAEEGQVENVLKFSTQKAGVEVGGEDTSSGTKGSNGAKHVDSVVSSPNLARGAN